MKTYVYDVEVFPNFFSVVFIDVDTPSSYIDAYEKLDYFKKHDLKKQLLDDYIKPYIFIVYDPLINELDLLMNFMTQHKTLIGFNSINYDDNILNYLIKNQNRISPKGIIGGGNHITKELYRLSQELIMYGNGWKWSNNDFKYFKAPYYSKDLQKLLYLDKKFVSLKQVAIQLKHYRLQDLPLPFTHSVKANEVDRIIDYNINDVIITYKLFHNQITEINLRESISELYGVNVRTESRSGTANKLMMSFYSENTGLSINDFKDERTERRVIKYKDIISDKIEFISPIFSNFLDSLKTKSLVIGTETLSENVAFNEKMFTIATGGLHSVDKPDIHKSTDTSIILDADALSFYPNIILNERAAPEHLDGEVYLNILETITNERIKAKTNASKLKSTTKVLENIEKYINLYQNKADALKITINAIYGKTGDQNSFLYDLKAMYKTTINGQLYLLMLVDMLADKDIKCISANTDGIICKLNRKLIDTYYEVCKEWEKKTNFVLEYATYDKYICHSVNNYIAVKEGFYDSAQDDKAISKYVKTKGYFVTEIQLDKGYKHPVVPKALLHFYLFNTSIEEFIRNHTDIYDFCISIKTGSDFIKEYHTIKGSNKHIVELQKNVRYYISNANGVIMKRYREPYTDKKGIIREYISLHKGYNSTVFNDYIPYDDFSKYKVNYNYYIKEAYKMIHEISNVIHRKTKYQSYGGLFKDLEDEL